MIKQDADEGNSAWQPGPVQGGVDGIGTGRVGPPNAEGRQEAAAVACRLNRREHRGSKRFTGYRSGN